MPFRDLTLDSFYEGWGEEITRRALLPILRETVLYDRLSSYFNIDSMIAIAEGIESIWQKDGRIRLVMGLHDLDYDIVQAHDKSKRSDLHDSFGVLKDRVLSRVSRLENEISRDRVFTFASMLKEGLIELKIASPPDGMVRAIFHNKRFVFQDEKGDFITGNGGMNETFPGLSTNFDDLTLQRSWIDSGTQLKEHIDSFERIWNGKRPDLIVRKIDQDFVDALAEISRQWRNRPQPREIPQPTDYRADRRSLKELLINSNEYFFHSLQSVALFPHQERVVQEALETFPVRKMLADEVGLGKTLEAGAVINFLATREGAKRICIACPQGLMRQWRDELSEHFGLKSWIWDSPTGTYESSDGETFRPRSGMPLASDRPDFVIISAHLLRTKRHLEYLRQTQQIDLDVFILDESHAARMTRNAAGQLETTKLWEVAKKLCEAATHTLLLTATPMQMSFIELYGQLRLLGLPGAWADPTSFETSIELLAGITDETALEQCKLVADLLSSSSDHNSFKAELNDTERVFLERLDSSQDAFNRAVLINQNPDTAHQILLKKHPAHHLVIRNTRDSLIDLNYKFPSRVHTAPPLEPRAVLADYFRQIEIYLQSNYGLVEKALSPDGSWSLGFAASGYYQRLASSLVASRATLSRRLARWKDLEQSLTSVTRPALFTDEDQDEGFEDFDFRNDATPESVDIAQSPQMAARVQYALNVEIAALGGLIATLDSLADNLWDADTKFAAALEAIQANRQYAPVLVFSRFTDTLDGFLEYLEHRFNDLSNAGYGYYSGGSVWLDYAGNRQPATKNMVVRALFDGRISILLCSDAASEGLNLQAAGTIINIDVPWNPARLEQRIGRIDRLGQKLEQVNIINLWYPESIEAQMYQRLISRKEQLELAVGKYPDVIARSIAEAVNSRLQTGDAPSNSNDLELFRDHTQEKALSRLWATGRKEAETQTQTVRKNAFEYFASHECSADLVSNLTIEEGFPDTFCVLHPGLDTFWRSPSDLLFATPSPSIFALCIDDRLARFVLSKGGKLHLLKNEVLSDIIGLKLGLIRLEDLDLSDTFVVEHSSSAEKQLAQQVLVERRLPLTRHNASEYSAELVPLLELKV